jgi:hypothetical protein
MAGAIIFGSVVVAALIGLLARQRGTPNLEGWSVGGGTSALFSSGFWRRERYTPRLRS